ncbi:hypothetical protein M404DRAFT_995426 [Pisolithus tinctorius Marx 270]|uniref:Uncharacterized protein n=1 Tax=Pisolithus tinctorius Marx 270 TaxID=870435 RepID=A0A0C3KKV3_PISTI|nr:hypothetical protein M404DRAFT_995426 [Pisolithus tinctorius Marx 270]
MRSPTRTWSSEDNLTLEDNNRVCAAATIDTVVPNNAITPPVLAQTSQHITQALKNASTHLDANSSLPVHARQAFWEGRGSSPRPKSTAWLTLLSKFSSPRFSNSPMTCSCTFTITTTPIVTERHPPPPPHPLRNHSTQLRHLTEEPVR